MYIKIYKSTVDVGSKFLSIQCLNKRNYVSYQQGQYVDKVREYFYYVDHQGMLYLDDSKIKNFTSRFKEKKFLAFFFNRLRRNETDRYKDNFPWISLCGRERNYLRCDDVPIVYTKILEEKDAENGQIDYKLSFGHADELLKVPFEPSKICMHGKTGRVYHPCPAHGGKVGLVISKLAIELSPLFDFKNGENQDPTHFTWNSEKYALDYTWLRENDKRFI